MSSPKDITEAGVPARWEDSEPIEPLAPPDLEEHPPSSGIPPGPPPDGELVASSKGAAAATQGAPIASGGNGSKPQWSGIKSQVTAEVEEMINRNKRVNNLWHSRGKTWEITEASGERVPLPTTGVGYDLSFLCELVKRGVRNKSVLATALWHRPDDAARLRGEEYVFGVVKRALEVIAELDDTQLADIDFTVEAIKVYNSDPPTYKIKVDGIGIRLSAEELINHNRFASRFLQRMRRIPRIPRKPAQWEAVVNSWLADAEIVDMPPEASTDTMTREVITDIIKKMAVGDKLSDLDLGRAVIVDGYRAIKTRPLLKSYCESEEKISTHQLCRHLRALGFETQTKREGDQVERVWMKKEGEVDDSVGTNEEEIDDWPEPGTVG